MANNFLTKIRDINKDYYTVSDLEKISCQKKKSLLVKLNRLVKNGELKRISKGYYQLAERYVDLEKIITEIYPSSYISFESALATYGILSQKPYALTLATTDKPKKIEMLARLVEFRRIKKDLFFGFDLVEGVYIAKPEKALADMLYMISKGKVTIDFSELDLKNIRKTLLLKYIKKYPLSVQKLVQELKICQIHPYGATPAS